MTKKKVHDLLSMQDFIAHIARNAALGLLLIGIALLIGMLGYHYFEELNWVDAFANASMILSGMGPFGPLTTAGGKIFAGFYALFSGLLFIMVIGLIFAPVAHRFIKRIHIEANESLKKAK